mgnify:CR=1 FL=1
MDNYKYCSMGIMCSIYLILSDLIKVEKGNREEKKLEKKD